MQRGNLNTAGSKVKPIIATAVEAMVDRQKLSHSHQRENRYVILSSPINESVDIKPQKQNP